MNNNGKVFTPVKIVKENVALVTVTIIYYDEQSLELQDEVKSFPQQEGGRVALPLEYRKGKNIVAICEGNVNILNKIGERILPNEQEMNLAS